MSADTLLQYLTEALFVLIFLVVAGRALRQPRRANLDTALLFGALLLIEIDSWATTALHPRLGYDVATVGATLIMALPYLLLRLVDDFTVVPRPWMIGGILGLALSTLSSTYKEDRVPTRRVHARTGACVPRR